MSRPVFKLYEKDQRYLFPLGLEDFTVAHHPCRVVSEVIYKIDIDIILKKYKPGPNQRTVTGTLGVHPKGGA
jgi:hypothetical protein